MNNAACFRAGVLADLCSQNTNRCLTPLKLFFHLHAGHGALEAAQAYQLHIAVELKSSLLAATDTIHKRHCSERDGARRS